LSLGIDVEEIRLLFSPWFFPARAQRPPMYWSIFEMSPFQLRFAPSWFSSLFSSSFRFSLLDRPSPVSLRFRNISRQSLFLSTFSSGHGYSPFDLDLVHSRPCKFFRFPLLTSNFKTASFLPSRGGIRPQPAWLGPFHDPSFFSLVNVLISALPVDPPPDPSFFS